MSYKEQPHDQIPNSLDRWQEYFRQYQPPTLIVWGKNDTIFPAEGAYPYQRDLKDVELHLLDTGHFALEEDGDAICASQQRFAIADHIRRFLTTHVAENTTLEGVMHFADSTVQIA